MEVYVPYIIGSTVSAFLGKVAYSYFSYDDDDLVEDDIKDIEINRNDYELINKKGEKEIFWKPLGTTMSQRTKAIKQICLDDCGFSITDKKHKKERERTLHYLNKYEELGHDEFVNRFIKKWKLKETYKKK